MKMLIPEPVAVSILYGFLPKEGRNPNASKLFLHWLASEGALVLESSTGRGNPYVQTTEMAKLLAGKKLSSTDVGFEVKNAERLVELNKIYAAALQGR